MRAMLLRLGDSPSNGACAIPGGVLPTACLAPLIAASVGCVRRQCDIVAAQEMPALASRLWNAVDFRVVALVLAPRHHRQMIGVDADAIGAGVVQHGSGWRRAAGELVAHPVRIQKPHGLPAPIADRTITVARGPKPKPAPRPGLHVFPEAFGERTWGTRHPYQFNRGAL